MAGRTVNKTVQSDETYYCISQISEKCKRKNGKLSASDFYSASNQEFFKNKKVHICKDCMKSFVYMENGEFNLDRFKKILMMIDYPFYQMEFESALADKKDTIGIYFKNIQLNHKGATWTTSDSNYDKQIINNEIVENNFEITQDMFVKWGKLPKDDIEFLENNYYQWTTRHQCSNRAEEILFEEICQMQLDIKKTRESSGDVIKKVEALQKLMTSANIRPLDQNAINTAENTLMIGTIISTIEKREPSEYFDEYRKKEYSDYMGYKKYFNLWILRPLKNLLANTKDFNVTYKEEKDGDLNV